ncbi:MAG: M56 family metallopeptidase [Flavobacteriaceae bacterium]
MIQYILESIAFQLLFLVIYDFFLKRETFFQWNRGYLIGTYILSLVLPWIKIEAFKTTVPEQFAAYPTFLWSIDTITPVATETASFTISWEALLFYGGMVLAALYFGYKIVQIYRLRKNGQVHYFPHFTRVVVSNSQLAFSFFKSIFLGDKVLEREHESIIKHEMVHIEQKHTWDLLYFELMRIVGWFNPLVYVYQNRVSELHEFIADAQVAKTHKKEQYETLLSQVFQTQHISFINQFFKSSLIKKRIVMLQKSRSKRVWQLKYLLLVPMVVGMLFYTSCEGDITRIENSSHGDAALIAKINSKIEDDFERIGSSYKVQSFEKSSFIADSDGPILSKDAYFESVIVFSMTMKKISQKIANDTGEELVDFSNNVPLPSTERYESYVKRKKAFQLLDENLKFSIKSENKEFGIDVQKLEKKDVDMAGAYVLKVGDITKLHGEEVMKFNNKMDEIFKSGNSNYSNMILKDGKYSFRVFATKPLQGINMFDPSEFKVKQANTKITNQRSNQMPISFTDVNQVPIFPGCENVTDKSECFTNKIQKHVVDHFKYPEQAQELGIQGKVYINFIIDEAGDITELRMRGPDKSLEAEAQRIVELLPKMTPGKHQGKTVKVPFSMPITFKLQ